MKQNFKKRRSQIKKENEKLAKSLKRSILKNRINSISENESNKSGNQFDEDKNKEELIIKDSDDDDFYD